MSYQPAPPSPPPRYSNSGNSEGTHADDRISSDTLRAQPPVPVVHGTTKSRLRGTKLLYSVSVFLSIGVWLFGCVARWPS